MGLSWCIARFAAGSEVAAARAADSSTNNQSFNGVAPRAFCPLHKRSWVDRGAKREVLVPVLSGYVFVQMVRTDAYRWHELKNQRGFVGFLGGEVPDPVRPAIVETMIAGADPVTWAIILEPPPAVRPRLRRGDLVRVRSGALADLRGRVEYVESNGIAAQVTLRGLFGRETRAGIDIDILDLLEKPRRRQPYTLDKLPVRGGDTTSGWAMDAQPRSG